MEQINKNDFMNNVQGILNEMKTQVDAYANQVFENNMAAKNAESAEYCLENIINKNGINLSESIKNIASSEASSNTKLMETIEQYAGALNNGLYEERLYESFINNISKFDYLLPVEKEIKRINEAVSTNAKSIEITKILEEMTATPSYYIIPMIEEDACRYVKTPSDVNRVQLRAILCPFASDPYCNLMLNTLEMKNDNYGKSIAEQAMSINDKIKFVRQDANVSQIYSPVQYIKENESVFNANGRFYVKKGNTIATLPDEYLNQLSEKFLTLCQLVNDPRVTMFDEHIVLTGNDKVASIYEDHIDINGNIESKENLRNINEMSMKYDFDNNFFITASYLCENFDNIAIINFGKHISLNHDNGVNVDMFRVGNNIYVNTVNENFMKSTFYSNVNPIQCRNLINKHMGINVASLFEDLIPSQEKVLVKLNEAKNEYEDSIAKYEESLEKLKDAKEKCTSEDNIKKIDDAIKNAETKLNDLKDEYKEWQKKAKDMTEVPESEEATSEKKDSDNAENNKDNVDVEKGNEPIKPEEVDDAKAELTQPLGNLENNDDAEDGPISDDEFNSYLETSNNPENFAEETSTDNVPVEENPVDDNVPVEENPENNNPEEMSTDNIENNVPVEENPENNNPEEMSTDNIENNVPVEENPIQDDQEGFTEMPTGENIDTTSDEEIDVNTGVGAEDEGTDETIDFDQMQDDINNDNYVTPELQAEGYKIANITFDQNVKTGEIFKTGTIIVITPMIDGTGKMYSESNNYKFYIDETTHHPVINTEGCPVALYNAMYNAIITDPGFEKADKEGAAIADIDKNEPNNSDIWYDADEVNKASDEITKTDDEFFNFIDDPENNTFTVTSKEEESPAENNVVPAENNTENTDTVTSKEEESPAENNVAPAENNTENTDTVTSKEEESPAENNVAPAENNTENADDIDDETVLSDIFNGYNAKNYTSNDEENNEGNSEIPANTASDPIPTYKSGETDIELPAATTDNTNIPEITSDEIENPDSIDSALTDLMDKTDDSEVPANADIDDDIDFDKEYKKLFNENDEDESLIGESLSLNEAQDAINKLQKEMKNRRNQIVSINETKKAINKMHKDNKNNK
ncbi:MAG: hypothetical protein [Wendovervirus sonii]|uniref:Uncharacterized protein n=1 Tax=phage Lak_Megaphage_Sonny TaxID=3109229 RepID=A0ABZ0Z3R3_9CAUD|nr:MAG: hypothetical protein [phage Lak_Megaphage_Sonny]